MGIARSTFYDETNCPRSNSSYAVTTWSGSSDHCRIHPEAVPKTGLARTIAISPSVSRG